MLKKNFSYRFNYYVISISCRVQQQHKQHRLFIAGVFSDNVEVKRRGVQYLG